MANPTVEVERYIGGGKLYFAPYNGVDYDTEVEIGEIQTATLKISPTYVDGFSKDTGIKKKVDKVLSEVSATISFSTQNVNKENMAMAMLGNIETETFADGSTLPDGTIADGDTDVPVIKGGVVPVVEGQLRLVGENLSGSIKPVLICHAVITPSGDIRDYFGDKQSVLPFDGEVIEKDNVYFKEYQMVQE